MTAPHEPHPRPDVEPIPDHAAPRDTRRRPLRFAAAAIALGALVLAVSHCAAQDGGAVQTEEVSR